MKTYKCAQGKQTPLGSAIVILAQTDLPGDDDLQTAAESLESLASSNPESRLIFVTSSENAKSFKALANRHPNAVVIHSMNADNIDTIVSDVITELSNVSRTVVNYYCNESQSTFIDYLTPGVPTTYEVRREYLLASTHFNINVSVA